MREPPISALKSRDRGDHASLVVEPCTAAGRILGIALLADSLPGGVQTERHAQVTASLTVRCTASPEAIGPTQVAIRRLGIHDPYVAVQGRILDAGGRLAATSLALFARRLRMGPRRVSVPDPAAATGDPGAPDVAAGPPPVLRSSADGLAARIESAVQPLEGRGPDGSLHAVVPVDPGFANRRGVMHGAVAYTILAIAAVRGASGEAPQTWPRIVDSYVRFLRPVDGPELALSVTTSRRSARSADLEVRGLTVDRHPVMVGHFLLDRGGA